MCVFNAVPCTCCSALHGHLLDIFPAGLDFAMAKSSANGQGGTGFASGYRLILRAGFKSPMGRCKATTHSSFSLTSNRVTINYQLITGVCGQDRHEL